MGRVKGQEAEGSSEACGHQEILVTWMETSTLGDNSLQLGWKNRKDCVCVCVCMTMCV